ncbi:hypothetical protein [Nibrella viscosa]|uniref:hypothetical protein n=1 Tax=Nibrella viscosa TaxID=1084524 RepID=UPI0031E923C8
MPGPGRCIVQYYSDTLLPKYRSKQRNALAREWVARRHAVSGFLMLIGGFFACFLGRNGLKIVD